MDFVYKLYMQVLLFFTISCIYVIDILQTGIRNQLGLTKERRPQPVRDQLWTWHP